MVNISLRCGHIVDQYCQNEKGEYLEDFVRSSVNPWVSLSVLITVRYCRRNKSIYGNLIEEMHEYSGNLS